MCLDKRVTLTDETLDASLDIVIGLCRQPVSPSTVQSSLYYNQLARCKLLITHIHFIIVDLLDEVQLIAAYGNFLYGVMNSDSPQMWLYIVSQANAWSVFEFLVRKISTNADTISTSTRWRNDRYLLSDRHSVPLPIFSPGLSEGRGGQAKFDPKGTLLPQSVQTFWLSAPIRGM